MLDFLQSRRIRLLWTALVHIGGAAGPVSGKDLAEKLDCSRRYLESDLQSLAQHGLLESRRGAHGGYILARSPHRISLYDVLTCLNSDCPEDAHCQCRIQEQIVLPQLQQAGQSVADALGRVGLADALEQAADARLMQRASSSSDFSI